MRENGARVAPSGRIDIASDHAPVAGRVTVKEAAETALVIPAPTADQVVGEWRDRLDPSCALGIPAHITLLYPFAPPSWFDQSLLDQLRGLFAETPSFGYELAGIRWFEDDVVWAEPKPADPFLRLTELVVARWPDFPPYKGAHAEVIPHLTIAQDCPRHQMEEAAAAVGAELPIQARADRVWLMSGSRSPDSWELRADFPLAT